jgi:hypothetical protein
MNKKPVRNKTSAALWAVPLLTATIAATAHAGVDLIAIGKIDGHYEDYALNTAPALESGVPGNILGGLGSGFTWAGGNTFLSVPDRGPNADVYNALIDNTTSYIPRFHTLHLSLAASAAGSALPYTLTPFVTDTTLLWNRTPLVYGNGYGLNVGNGAPALNQHNQYYFSGRSDNFDASKPSTYANNGRLDPESIRVANDGKSVFITDEYGPYVYQFDRSSGQRIRVFSLPAKFAATKLSPLGDTEITGNTIGRVANKGMEGLAISPDGKTLFGVMQSPLIQDGGTDAPYTRIVKIDVRSGNVSEYAYELTNIGTAAKPKYPTISEIVAINGNEFLLDERDGKGLGDGSNAVFKRLYRVNLAKAADVSQLTGAAALAPKAVVKTLFLDVVTALTAHGFTADAIPAKLEGVSFGPDVVIDGVSKRTLYIANDNDFTATVNGVANPNTFFVFAIDKADLPGYVAQQIQGDGRCDKDGDRDHDDHGGNDHGGNDRGWNDRDWNDRR